MYYYFAFMEVKYDNCLVVDPCQQEKKVIDREMYMDFIVCGSWVIFGVFCFWYFFAANTLQPLTLEDVGLTWRFHKRQMGCAGSRINDLLMKDNEVVGFRCECGYEFRQRRLITQKVRQPTGSLDCSDNVAFGKLETIGD